MSENAGPQSDPDSLSHEELDRLCMRNLLDASGEVIYFKDRHSRFLRVSAGLVSLHRRPEEEILGRSDYDLFASEHACQAYADEQNIIATGVGVVNQQERETWADRGDTWVSTTKLPLKDNQGNIVGTFGISRDVTRLVVAEQQARDRAMELAATNEELGRTAAELATVLETSPDAIVRYDSQLRYRYANSAAERALGRSQSELVGRQDDELGHADPYQSTWLDALEQVAQTGERQDIEYCTGEGENIRWFHSQLVPAFNADGSFNGLLASTRDLTAQKRAERALAYQALHDPVTGLANRVLLTDRLGQALLRLERQPGRVAVLFVDLDHFKDINDSLGHDTGDRLLMQVARRLRGASRRIDTVARFGGDEFVILCDKLRAEEDVRLVADRVVRSLNEPIDDRGKQLHVSASVGIVITDDPFCEPADLLRDADSAMYQAKARGRNRFQFFDSAVRDRATARHVVETELRVALAEGQLRLFYQPLFALAEQRLIGVEALVRWEHPTRGLLAPAEFISVAEDRGLIGELGSWVLGEACRQLAVWSAARDPREEPFTVAVNVSGGQLRDPHFAELVSTTLDRHGLSPAQLCLEITETALIEEAVEAYTSLAELTRLGVRLALDDFGTGYSSLAHLRSFPVDILKIDRSFVDRVDHNDRERQIVAAVTAMAHALGMTVVGEGIETSSQLSQLTDLSCDDGQGYLLGRPLPANEVDELLRSYHPPVRPAITDGATVPAALSATP